MKTRRIRVLLGVLSGFATFGAVAWFSYDVVVLLGGEPRNQSTLSILLVTVFAILSALEVGALVAVGAWMADETFPKEWVWATLVGTGILYVLSVVPA